MVVPFFRLEVPVVQCDHNLLVTQSLQGIKPGGPRVVPHPVPEDPGIGLTPAGQRELPNVEGQHHPLNKAFVPAYSSSPW